MDKIITNSLTDHKQALADLEGQLNTLEEIASLCLTAIINNGKVILMGNGGSAADAQHLAAELVGRFKKNRKSLPALALTTNTSTITAIGNDFGFEEIFVRQLAALAQPQDVVIAISTSGKSENLIRALKTARELELATVGLLGQDGGPLKKLVDTALVIASSDTARIQEMHILAGHIICEIVEEKLT